MQKFKKEYLLKLKEIIDQKDNQEKIKPCNLQENFNKSKNSINKVVIHNLQEKINNIKKENNILDMHQKDKQQ